MLRLRLIMPPLVAILTDAGRLGAQPRVVLELRPVPGDTIRMRIDQETEILGQRAGGSRAGSAARGLAMKLQMWSRAIIRQRAATGTSVQTITDSVRLTTTDPQSRALAARTERALAGREMHLLLASDGTARVVGTGSGQELAAIVSSMPAALPGHSVAVGEQWRREMPVPSRRTTRGEGVIRAVFRLDSLTKDGALAWISVRGQIHREPVAENTAHEMSGSLVGTLTLDRRRGWLDDTRFELVVHTSVTTAGDTIPPMAVVTKISQRMRADARRDERGARP